ncbi:helix-turn-helix domain-containing protein [Nonomuraea sp. NPDC055795]
MLEGADSVTTREEFARELTALRERAGLTVREVARAIGKPAATVGDYFAGAHLPPVSPPKLLADLLAACGVKDLDEVARWQRALLRVRRAPGRRPTGARSPYRGLASFQPEDAEWFYGRERLTDLVIERLGRDPGSLLVVGPSGSGKSSLLRAGLVPAIRSGALDGAARSTLLLTPGAQPLRALAEQLTTVAGGTVDDVAAALRSNPRKAIALAGGAVLVVDQLEEMFTLCADAGERQAFMMALCADVTSIAGLRADFYGEALRQAELAELIQDRQIVVGPMTETELRRAIVEPARRARLNIEDGLVELILTDLAAPSSTDAYEAGALPMLSHTLLMIWERARRGRLTIADYHACGGIAGAVRRTAEEIYLDELNESERALARALFLRLVRIGEAGQDTRRRVAYADLLDVAPGTEDVLARFVDRRLLTMHEETVEISHEALITGWPRLQVWIDADRSGLRAVQLLDDAAREWEREAHDPTHLYTGTRLLAVRDLTAAGRQLSRVSRSFLDASIRRDKRRVRRLYQAVAGFAVLTLLAATGGIVAVREREQAVEQRTTAVSRLVAGRADWTRGTDVALAAQLSLVAYRIAPTEEARSSLLNSSAVPEVTRLFAGSGVAHSVAFASNRKILASGNSDGTIRLWDFSGPKGPVSLGPPLTGSGAPVYSVAFSPDGHAMATAGAGGVVRLWDVTDPRRPLPSPPISGLGKDAQALVFSPDGRTLAVGGSGVHLIDRDDLARPRSLRGPRGLVQAVAFSPDGLSLAAGGSDRDVWLWRLDRDAGTSLGDVKGVVYSVAFSPDGRTLAAGTSDKTVRLWNVTGPGRATARPTPLTGPRSWVYSVAFSPDGRTIAAACADDTVYLWDLATGRATGHIPHPGPVTSVAYAQDGRLLLTGAQDGSVRAWRLPGPARTGIGSAMFTVAFSTDGRTLAAAAGDHTVRLWDVRQAGLLVPAGEPLRAGTHLDGTLAYGPGARLAAGRDDGSVELWDVTDPAQPIPAGTAMGGLRTPIQSVAFNGSGRLMAAGDSDGDVQLWDSSDRRHPVPLATLATTKGKQAFMVAFSPDSLTLAVASADLTVWLWDLSTPSRPRAIPTRLRGPTNYAYHVVFSPDGRVLAVASADGTVRRWDMTAPGRPQPMGDPLTGPRGVVYAVAFSPDGRTLATANTDKSVWMWDLQDQRHPRRLALLTGATGTVFSVAYSPDGHTLAAGSQDGSVRLWNTSPDAVARTICATAGDAITTAEWAQYVQEPAHPYTPPCPN